MRRMFAGFMMVALGAVVLWTTSCGQGKDTAPAKVAKEASAGRTSALGDDADRIMRIAAQYQASIRKGLAGGATSVQREQVVRSADQDFPAEIENIKSATLYFRLKDVTEVNDIRYPNRRKIILEAPEQLPSSAAILRVNGLEVEGHQTELMNLKPGDAVCLRGKIAYFKGGALSPGPFGDDSTFTIGRAQTLASIGASMIPIGSTSCPGTLSVCQRVPQHSKSARQHGTSCRTEVTR